MTVQQKLKQIENSVKQEDGHCNMNDNYYDILWLFSYITQLQRALRFYAMGHWNGDVSSSLARSDFKQGEIAEEALNKMPDYEYPF